MAQPALKFPSAPPEDLQRQALDALHIAVGTIDSNGVLLESNRFWRNFPVDTGLSGACYGVGENYVHQCDRALAHCAEGPAAAAGIREVLAGKRPGFSITYRAPTAERMRYFELRAQPFVDESATPAVRGAFISHIDVSATREAYDALEHQRDFYENILNAIPLRISYVDKHERIRYMNRSYESWFQLPLNALQGRSIPEMTTPGRYAELKPRIDKVLGGASVEFEQRVPRVDGTLRDLSMAYVPHKDGNHVAGFVAVVRDVTEHKRLEASLQQSQKMEAIGQLTGGMAHDFNNLLSAIIGNLQLLERPLRGHNRLLKHVNTSLHAALRGADLTRRLLAFARQTPLEPQLSDVNVLMRNMQELLGHSLGREIDIQCTLAENLWSTKVDPCQFENCVLNLAINARDAMRGGGKLSISTSNTVANAELRMRHPQLRQAEYVLVTVSDTGTGMSAEVVKHAFEPFFSTKEVGKGTGLGLSMVYGFLEQSGGLATLHSAPGAGTTIRLYFPRAAGAAAGCGEDTMTVRAIAPRGTETVLVVEDDADVRATAAGALRSFGYKVLEAGSAVEGIEALDGCQGKVDLLFSDIALPGGIHGPALAKRAQQMRPGLKVLFTSGFTESMVLHRGLVADDQSLIPKPYALTDLASRVRAVLDRE